MGKDAEEHQCEVLRTPGKTLRASSVCPPRKMPFTSYPVKSISQVLDLEQEKQNTHKQFNSNNYKKIQAT